MKRTLYATLGTAIFAATLPAASPAQTFATDDPVLRQIWDHAMNRSQVEELAQALLDSIGPRLAGTPGMDAAHRWAVERYEAWGIPARNETYGTWIGWRRGTSHIDLIAPRVRTLEGMNLAWSPGTAGPVEGGVVVLPDVRDEAAFRRWLPAARGNFVMVSPAQPSCRPNDSIERFGTEGAADRMRERRTAVTREWNRRIGATGSAERDLPLVLEEAGALGIVTTNWSGGWSVTRVFNGRTRAAPTFQLSCEDYGLVFRLAERHQGPRLRVNFDAEFLGEAPVFNTIAEIRGTELPDEYVILSAHFDSWDAASGATDNGTGTVTMMEAMRILRLVYPNPRRTILVGHWGGEEQGLNGSRAFVEDNPAIVENLQLLLNQDNGTGRVERISMEGLTDAAGPMARWLAHVPFEVNRHVELIVPGTPSTGGTDHAAFICAGAPAFGLFSNMWDYFTYTWHTNRDTFDKLMFEELRNNVVLVASLAYLASEDPERVPRTRRTVMPRTAGASRQAGWPECQSPHRTAETSPRV